MFVQVGGSDSRLSVSSPSSLPRLHAHRSQPSLAHAQVDHHEQPSLAHAQVDLHNGWVGFWYPNPILFLE